MKKLFVAVLLLVGSINAFARGDFLITGNDFPPDYKPPAFQVEERKTTDSPSMQDYTRNIPLINAREVDGFTRVPDVAQYGRGDWSQVVGMANDISLEKAGEIAKENPFVTYFFYMRNGRMTLPTQDTNGYYTFIKGDAVFFAGEPHWGSAKGFSDGYIRRE